MHIFETCNGQEPSDQEVSGGDSLTPILFPLMLPGPISLRSVLFMSRVDNGEAAGTVVPVSFAIYRAMITRGQAVVGVARAGKPEGQQFFRWDAKLVAKLPPTEATRNTVLNTDSVTLDRDLLLDPRRAIFLLAIAMQSADGTVYYGSSAVNTGVPTWGRRCRPALPSIDAWPDTLTSDAIIGYRPIYACLRSVDGTYLF